MRRILLTAVVIFGLVTGIASGADASAGCVTVKAPRPCAGVPRCVWGGDPDAIWVTVKGGTRKLALARARRALLNVRSAGVKPRTLDLRALVGRKLKTLLSSLHHLHGRHWHYSVRRNCWYVK